MLGWKVGLGGEQVADRELVPYLLLLRCEVVPWNDSSRENSASRIGSLALCGQGAVGYYLNSKVEPVTGLKILLEHLRLRCFCQFFSHFALALFL